MKTRILAIAALAATTLLASCNKESGNGNVPAGQKAKLTVNVVTPETRSTGSASTSDNVISKYSIFVFDAAGALVCPIVKGTGVGPQIITATTSAKEVYVVANAPENTFDAVTNKTALLAYITDLNDATDKSQYSKRWATGSTGLTFTQSGSDFSATASVAMTFIAARITVNIVNGMTGYDADATDKSLVLGNVVILNAGGTSKLFNTSGTSLIPTTKTYYTGIPKGDTFEYWPVASCNEMTDPSPSPLKDAIPANNFSQNYYYYVFENNAITPATNPTIIAIEGMYGGKKIYFPVHLAPYEQFKTGSLIDMTASVLRGYSYNVTITLTGNPIFPGGDTYPGDTGGTDDPTNPTITSKVTVTMSITDWTPVVLEKKF